MKTLTDALTRFDEAAKLTQAGRDQIGADIQRTERTLGASPLRVPVEHAGVAWDQASDGAWRLLWVADGSRSPLAEAPDAVKASLSLVMPEFLDACTAALRRISSK